MSRMYFIINSDLEMSPGKVAAQVGHGTQYVMEYYLKNPNEQDLFFKYARTGSTKIILRGRLNKILALHKKYPDCSFLVTDAGKTEIAPNSITVLAFLPLTAPVEELKRFSLY